MANVYDTIIPTSNILPFCLPAAGGTYISMYVLYMWMRVDVGVGGGVGG